MNAEENLDFVTPDAISVLYGWLKDGVVNPLGENGVVWLDVHDEQSPSEKIWRITVKLCRSGHCEVTQQHDRTSDAKPDAQLRMPLSSAEQIVENIGHMDYRDPALMATLHMTGNRALINHVGKALLRPSDDARARLMFATCNTTPAYQITALDRVHQPTEHEILRRIAAREPFVATGMATTSQLEAWSLDALEDRYGKESLRVRSATEHETVAEFLQRVRATLRGDACGPVIEGATKAYTEGCALPQALRREFLPHRFTLDDYNEPQIWLGAVPTEVAASSLHRDPMDGFLFQVIGRKKILMYAPDEASNLYCMQTWNNYQPCWVDPAEPRLDVFPLFENAKGIEVILHPGELLIQPAGWFHAVYCLDSPTFSVSYFLKH